MSLVNIWAQKPIPSLLENSTSSPALLFCPIPKLLWVQDTVYFYRKSQWREAAATLWKMSIITHQKSCKIYTFSKWPTTHEIPVEMFTSKLGKNWRVIKKRVELEGIVLTSAKLRNQISGWLYDWQVSKLFLTTQPIFEHSRSTFWSFLDIGRKSILIILPPVIIIRATQHCKLCCTGIIQRIFYLPKWAVFTTMIFHRKDQEPRWK